MKPISENPIRAVQIFEPDDHEVYTLEMVGQITQMPRREILIYCKHGLLSAAVDPEYGGYSFDGEEIRRLQQIQYLHHTCGINLEGVKMIFQLVNEVERMQNELRCLRR